MNNEKNYTSLAISALYPNYGFGISPTGEISWSNGLTPEGFNEQLVQDKATELEAEYDAAQYQRDRAKAYPSIGDQLDMIFHAGLGGDEFQAAIQAVKDANPKPE